MPNIFPRRALRSDRRIGLDATRDFCHGLLWGVRPVVLTIHDCSYARHPEWYPYRQDAIRRTFYRRCALIADVVITDSEFSRTEIAAAYPIPPERIVVIPLAVGPPFVTSGAHTPARRTGDGGLYALHVGDLHPRRDLMTALDAVLGLRQRHTTLAALRLLLVGLDRGTADSLRHAAQQARQPGALEITSGLDDTALAHLYRQASVFVYPSVYEGFGLPLLEAMACGAPVVAARASATPELVGDAGLLVEPQDPAGMADAIHAVLSQPDLASQLRDRGHERASRFTWTRTAERTVELYRRCVAGATDARVA